jgi:hypothetical protein
LQLVDCVIKRTALEIQELVFAPLHDELADLIGMKRPLAQKGEHR